MLSNLTDESRAFFLEQLRRGRAAVQRDSEAFSEVLFAFERLGSFLSGNGLALGRYRKYLEALAKRSPLYACNGSLVPCYHSSFGALFEMVREARNDAMHQGARARHLAEHAMELALVLEDALVHGRDGQPTVGDVMVRSPVTAELWHPVSYVRQLMLTESFSYLPVLSETEWKLSDRSVARFLGAGRERKENLFLPLNVAVGRGLELLSAHLAAPDDPLETVLEYDLDLPVLVSEPASGRLAGIVTAFDLL